ncbi:flagellar hook-length control protein FliK [Pseudooceanicola nanhaiensis]|uniref:flagellar hook-length control protein FliK n=1 Tax=Pseudooceanicola nanhaiensis TaxID=375761 RepID=UPI001CD7CD7E|nr:flagellar hook-length control protein FliK [Pseudooceanicola nanhaiensis]MCA0922612.1 flagellar hook-length control protein FliK [Pseudooceanicola nanhaiensis]
MVLGLKVSDLATAATVQVGQGVRTETTGTGGRFAALVAAVAAGAKPAAVPEASGLTVVPTSAASQLQAALRDIFADYPDAASTEAEAQTARQTTLTELSDRISAALAEYDTAEGTDSAERFTRSLADLAPSEYLSETGTLDTGRIFAALPGLTGLPEALVAPTALASGQSEEVPAVGEAQPATVEASPEAKTAGTRDQVENGDALMSASAPTSTAASGLGQTPEAGAEAAVGADVQDSATTSDAGTPTPGVSAQATPASTTPLGGAASRPVAAQVPAGDVSGEATATAEAQPLAASNTPVAPATGEMVAEAAPARPVAQGETQATAPTSAVSQPQQTATPAQQAAAPASQDGTVGTQAPKAAAPAAQAQATDATQSTLEPEAAEAQQPGNAAPAATTARAKDTQALQSATPATGEVDAATTVSTQPVTTAQPTKLAALEALMRPVTGAGRQTGYSAALRSTPEAGSLTAQAAATEDKPVLDEVETPQPFAAALVPSATATAITEADSDAGTGDAGTGGEIAVGQMQGLTGHDPFGALLNRLAPMSTEMLVTDRPQQPAPMQSYTQLAATVSQTVRGEVLQNGSTRIEVSTQDLGRIQVELMQADDGDLNITLRSDNPQVLSALRADRDLLMNLLRDSGVQMGGGSLSLEDYGQGGSRGQDSAAGQSGQTAPQGAATADDEPAEDLPPASHIPTLGPGQVDILT